MVQNHSSFSKISDGNCFFFLVGGGGGAQQS